MKELFEKEGQSIFTFKKGDIIIRLKPAVTMRNAYNENLGIATQVATGFRNDFREPMEFVAVENNKIYLKYLCKCLEGRVAKANLEEFADDWALFVIPDGLTIDDCF